MVASDIHDIVLHCGGTKVLIPNVDPQNYMFINLLSDVAKKALHEMPRDANLLLHMRCAIPRIEGYNDMNDDEVVHEMFKVHQGQLVINIQVFNMDNIPAKQGDMLLSKNIVGDHENLGIPNKHVASKKLIIISKHQKSMISCTSHHRQIIHFGA